ncbi:hypothetical protein [Cohnella nanjingensis]|uniref:Uncharacterized protein n=1 Tax=Cohnella nanjingensis TaxID=1387779 RepID=A0A7X0RTH7_9BACL|nr:hypothetical protein [Cohnella nanjingensis]MBB6672105.1 hypothetical protein [Cohnella nanjingensis]
MLLYRSHRFRSREVEAQKQGNGYILRDRTGQVGGISYQTVDVDTWIIIDHIDLDRTPNMAMSG